MPEAVVTTVAPGSIRDRVLRALEAKRAPLLKERDALHAQLHEIIAKDGPGQQAVRDKLYAINQAGDIFRLDQMIAAVHRDKNAKPIPGVKTVAEQFAEMLGIK